MLDLILTSADISIDHLIHPSSDVYLSDHFVISFDLFLSVPSVSKVKPCYAFDFRKADYNSITSFLLDYDYDVIILAQDY